MYIRLWHARKHRGLTLVELACLSGISKTTLNNIENQKVMPTIAQLETLAKVMDIHITDLFDSPYK